MSQCPKCGSKAIYTGDDTSLGGFGRHTKYDCGSIFYDGRNNGQSSACRIRELEQQVERLTAELETANYWRERHSSDAAERGMQICDCFEENKRLDDTVDALKAAIRDMRGMVRDEYMKTTFTALIAAACRERGVTLEN